MAPTTPEVIPVRHCPSCLLLALPVIGLIWKRVRR